MTTPDGQNLRFRLIAPGEPTSEREYPFIILGYLGAFLWAPFGRGFDTIYRKSFIKSADAGTHPVALRQLAERGEPIPASPEEYAG